MKTLFRCVVYTSFVLTCLTTLLAQSTSYAPPVYRGKIILIVDQTVAADPQVSDKLDRLKQDLVGDGWRVIRHDVPRGPDWTYPIGAARWKPQNATAVRQVRSIIKADNDGDSAAVKAVFLVGHIAIPYSGISGGLNGGHYSTGSGPADTFYGEMTSGFGADGWDDNATSIITPFVGSLQESDNYPADGEFDNDIVPTPMKLAVGRLDFYHATGLFGINETSLISMYLNKDHDFRNEVFPVQRRAILSSDYQSVDNTFGANNVSIFQSGQWFSMVSGNGDDYLLGGAFGTGDGGGQHQIGRNTDFVTQDSRVVFVNLRGSWFYDWDANPVLNTPLANPYDPAHGRHGYGLDCIWGDGAPDLYWGGGPELTGPVLTNRMMGETIGDAIFPGNTISANLCLMGDPSLRMHSVLPPGNLTATSSGSSVTLSWTASTDATDGYNIYYGPTRNGPYVLANTTGPVTSTSYTATRPSSGAPDNFYMVRTVKTETSPVGSYVNMSEGILAPVSTFTAYLNILANPANQTAFINTGGGIANSVAFSVDAAGSDTNGDEYLTYTWYGNGVPLYDNGHFTGTRTPVLLINGIQSSDAGNYFVVVGNASGELTSSSASLTLKASLPVANPDTYTVIRNTPTDFNVLANDTGTGSLSLVSISSLSDQFNGPGTITINPDGQTVHFVPAETYLGTVTFTYVMKDSLGEERGTVTLNIVPNPNDTLAFSSIANQQLSQDEGLDIPFTVEDSYTPLDALVLHVFSSPAGENISITGSGANRVLHIGPIHTIEGPFTVTLTTSDYDQKSASVSFLVTMTPDTTVPVTSGETMGSVNGASAFSFNMTAVPGSQWNLYQSSDLINWALLGLVTFDSSGAASFSDDSTAGVAHRFYKLSNGSYCSQPFGFVNQTLPGNGGKVLISNPLSNGANGAESVLSGLHGGETLMIWFGYGYHNYIFAGVGAGTSHGYQSDWKDGGSSPPNPPAIPGDQTDTADGVYWAPEPILAPGTSFFVINSNATENNIFVGTVVTTNSVSIADGPYVFLSSAIPVAGSVGSPAINLTANFHGGENLFLWNGSGYSAYTYNGAGVGTSLGYQSDWTDGSSAPPNPPSIPGDQLDTADGVYWAPAPTLSIGQGFELGNSSGATEQWNQSIDVCSEQSSSSPPNLINEAMSGGNFSFNIVNGPPNSYWGVYTSSDLMNWTLVAGLTLDGSGNSTYTDQNVANVSARFYKLSNSGVCSQVIGFVNQTLPGNGGKVLISNALSNGANGAESVLSGLHGGETLMIWFGYGYHNYIFAGAGAGTSHGYQSDWKDGGSSPPSPPAIPGDQTDTADGVYWAPEPVLAPGMSFFVINPNAAENNTFVGTAVTTNSVSIADGPYVFLSSAIPVAGSVQSPAINLTANFHGGENLFLWNGSGYSAYTYNGAGVGTSLGYQSDWTDGSSAPPNPPSIPGDQIDTADGVYWAPAPTLSIGQGFELGNSSGATEQWNQSIDVCSEQSSSSPPNLINEAMSGGNFSFNIVNGPPNSYWGVYTSSDMMNWTLVAGLTLDGSGNSSYTDQNVANVSARFYKLSDSGVCSQVIGFVNQTLPGNGGEVLISNPLSNGANRAESVLSGLHGGETLMIWFGYGFYKYIFAGAGAGTSHGHQSDWKDGGSTPPNPPAIPGDQTDTADGVYWAPEPILAPGTSFFVINPNATENNLFVGTAATANSESIPNGIFSYLSSVIPAAGSVGSPAINLTANFQGGENLFLWNGSGYSAYTYNGAGVGTSLGYQSDWTDGNSAPPNPPSIPGDQTDTADGVYWAPAPTLSVGQGFELQNSSGATEQWNQSADLCPEGQ